MFMYGNIYTFDELERVCKHCSKRFREHIYYSYCHAFSSQTFEMAVPAVPSVPTIGHKCAKCEHDCPDAEHDLSKGPFWCFECRLLASLS